MAGRGMGAASRGGGDVSTGPKNKRVSEPSMKTGKVLLMADGGAVNQHKRMAMGMMDGGMPMRGYNKGGIAMGKGRPLQIAQTAPAKGTPKPLPQQQTFDLPPSGFKPKPQQQTFARNPSGFKPKPQPIPVRYEPPAPNGMKKGGAAKKKVKKKVKKMRYGGSCD